MIQGFRPFQWQEELFERLVNHQIPPLVDLPTGAGKTSVMTIWLLALAEQTRLDAVTFPRRLVWVVDRRVVVDQATFEADNLAKRLKEDPSLVDLEYPLAISTLRGEREDNREWSKNPARPAIIVGTVDMIGSRLLFSGYGDGRYFRPQHAGLLGTDSLIVNDEAHLTPAFAELLAGLATRTALRHIRLSATPRASEEIAFPKSLAPDLADPSSAFAKRFRAVKRLHLECVEKSAEAIEERALIPDRRTIVFVRSPESARKLGALITKRHNIPVPLLTGMQRGKERDGLLQNEIVKRFLSKDTPAPDQPPCWLVATSAGEVGIDLSADRLITDLDTADHLLQRFGRLNRFGTGEGDAHVVYSERDSRGKDGERLQATVDYLKSCGGSVSPEVLRLHPPPSEALSAIPARAPLAPWLIDVWSLTSIANRDWPARPAVAPWLRGQEDSSAPETYVAWRDDVKNLADQKQGASTEEIEKILDVFPIRAYECLKQYTQKLCEELLTPEYSSTWAILIGTDASVRVDSLDKLLNDESLVRYATLLLPPCIGHLDANGMVDWRRGPDDKSEYDVSCSQGDRQKRMDEVVPDGLQKRLSINLGDDDSEEPVVTWTYYTRPKKGKLGHRPTLLDDHQSRVADAAADLSSRLHLNERVFRWAAQWHDQGKGRNIWQRAAGNLALSPSIAKCDSSHVFRGRALGGYRHEFGSLLDAKCEVPADFSAEERDLALHLIASHHGWARPHFHESAYDKHAVRYSQEIALECAQRFGRLQQSYGPWGLAYVEAVFRAADAMASEESPEQPPDA